MSTTLTRRPQRRAEPLEERRMLTLQTPADITADGVVDEHDYDALVGDFNSEPTADTDLNGDGVVDLHDFALFKESFLAEVDVASAEQDAIRQAVLPSAETPAMDLKLQQAFNTLIRQNQTTETYLQGIDEVMEALFMGNLVVLPTADQAGGGDPDAQTQGIYDDFLTALDQAIDELGFHGERNTRGTPDSAAPALEARNMLELFAEELQVIAEQTAQCDPNGLTGAGCGLLQGPDDVLLLDDPTGIPTQAPGRAFPVSPFPFFNRGASKDGGDEVTIVTDPLANGEMAVVLKEIRGVTAIVRPIQVPIWREPWFSRRTIIGTRTIWVWEFVPAEFIKTITLYNNNGAMQTTVNQRIVIDRGLLHFWKFYQDHKGKH